jgi:hypothetical protein
MRFISAWSKPGSSLRVDPEDGLRSIGYTRSARLHSLVSSLSHVVFSLHTLQFVEDEGSVVFYKNAYGLAAARPVLSVNAANDSGVEVDT